MHLAVDKITDISRAYVIRFTAGEMNCHIDPAQQEPSGPFADDVLVDFRLSRNQRKLLLNGEIRAEIDLQCGRCLSSYPAELLEQFSLALNLVEDEEGSSEEDQELDADQISCIPVKDGEVDLRPVLFEQVMLSLPLYPVCNDNCRGLCPYCGIDLKTEQCQCEPKVFNNRFGKLIDLKLDRS